MNTSFICQYFGKNTKSLIGVVNSDFRNRSYSDVSGKYQNRKATKTSEKTRILGLLESRFFPDFLVTEFSELRWTPS